jgi:hypothetical protein
MTGILAGRSEEKRQEGIALIREADDLLCQSWNEKMWSDSGPIDPSPTLDQAINGGYPWLEVECSMQDAAQRRSVCAAAHTPMTCVHDLASRLAVPNVGMLGNDQQRPCCNWVSVNVTSRANDHEPANAKAKGNEPHDPFGHDGRFAPDRVRQRLS